MRTFFIDIASHTGLLACVDDERVVASAAADKKISDADLLPLVEECWKDANWKSEDIERVACVIGPGGFMSLRVAVSFANTLAWSRNIPSTGIHLADLYTARLPSGQSCGVDGGCDTVWLHSTKKEELFVQGFGRLVEFWLQPTHVTLGQLAEHLPEKVQWMGELIPEHQEWMKERSATQMELQPVIDILPSFLATRQYKQQTLEPWYGRGW